MKKLWTTLLCVVMIVTFMPAMAFAAEDAETTPVKVVDAAGLAAALTNAETGKETTLELTDNIQLTGCMVIENNKSIIIDGKGHQIYHHGDSSYMSSIIGGAKLTLKDVTVNGNKVDQSITNMNPLINVSGGELAFENGAKVVNGSYGAVYVDKNGKFTMNGGEISGNSYEDTMAPQAAAVHLGVGTAFTMTSGTITGNSAKATLTQDSMNIGSIIYVSGKCSVNLNGGAITANQATAEPGENEDGGVARAAIIYGHNADEEPALINLNGTTISNNTTEGYAPVTLWGAKMTMNGGAITGNTAANAYGGAINIGAWVYNGVAFKASLTISDGEISNNKCDGDGGAILAYTENPDQSDLVTVDIQGGKMFNNYANSGSTVSNLHIRKGVQLNLSGSPDINGDNYMDFTDGEEKSAYFYPIKVTGAFTPARAMILNLQQKAIRDELVVSYAEGLTPDVNAFAAPVSGNYGFKVNSDNKGIVVGEKTYIGGGTIIIDPIASEKKAAKEEINGLVNLNDYDSEDQAAIEQKLKDAAALIEKAKTKEEIQKIIDDTKAAVESYTPAKIKEEIAAVQSAKFIARSKHAKLNGKKAIKVYWNAPTGVKLDGYEVFRSTKKYSGFGKTPFFKSRTLKYINNKALKKGKTYYYKVRGYKVIDGKTYYTQWSTKAWRKIK